MYKRKFAAFYDADDFIVNIDKMVFADYESAFILDMPTFQKKPAPVPYSPSTC